ncbi:MAG: hypothetical protein ACKVVT_07395 [Dehalococcoidia bacterium]
MTANHPRYNLRPVILSGLYKKALRDAGYGEPKGWHCPNGSDAHVLMESGLRFVCRTNAQNQVDIVPIEGEA